MNSGGVGLSDKGNLSADDSLPVESDASGITDRRRLIEQCCLNWEVDLKAFLLGVLRDRHQAEDCYQRLVIQALRRFDDARPLKIRGWLFQIALNEARQLMRSQKRLRESGGLSELTVAEPVSQYSTPVQEAGLIAEERRVAVQRALASLPAELKQIVVLRMYEGKSFAAIADSLQMPLGTVLTRMRRAVQHLREEPTLRSWFQE